MLCLNFGQKNVNKFLEAPSSFGSLGTDIKTCLSRNIPVLIPSIFSFFPRARELGLDHRFTPVRLSSEYGTRHMLSNSMLKEYPVLRPKMNKIFCSQWLSHRQIVFGTKCNKVREWQERERNKRDQIWKLRPAAQS